MSHKIYEQTSRRVQRSELAVPGSNPKMFEKALNSDVDFVFLDLEDAVAPDDKVTRVYALPWRHSRLILRRRKKKG